MSFPMNTGAGSTTRRIGRTSPNRGISFSRNSLPTRSNVAISGRRGRIRARPMRFNSFIFLAFLPTVCIVLWLLPVRLRRWWLLIASYVFYGSWHWPYLALLFSVATLNHFGARWIIAGQNRAPRRLGAGGEYRLAGALQVFGLAGWKRQRDCAAIRKRLRVGNSALGAAAGNFVLHVRSNQLHRQRDTETRAVARILGFPTFHRLLSEIDRRTDPSSQGIFAANRTAKFTADGIRGARRPVVAGQRIVPQAGVGQLAWSAGR